MSAGRRRLAVLLAGAVAAFPAPAPAAQAPAFDDALAQAAGAESPFARKALELKRQVEQRNDADLASLHGRLRGCFPEGAALARESAFLDRLAAKLRADRAAFMTMKAALDAKTGSDRGSTELRTSLAKLIGTGRQSGILEDAVALLASPGVLDREPRELGARHNEVTVLKTLLLYAVLVAQGRDDLTGLSADIDRTVRLLYPVELPAHLDPALVACVGLACRAPGGGAQLRVPNAGFVYGGDLVAGECRGLDCSAFLSHCTGSSERLSTMVLEYVWRELANGPGSFDPKELAARDEFLKDWGMKAALEEYAAVSPAPGSVRAGDLVIWRWTQANGGREGHAVMHLAPVPGSPGEFFGIEANREDDKSLEGIVVRRLPLARAAAETYVLRRKPAGGASSPSAP